MVSDACACCTESCAHFSFAQAGSYKPVLGPMCSRSTLSIIGDYWKCAMDSFTGDKILQDAALGPTTHGTSGPRLARSG